MSIMSSSLLNLLSRDTASHQNMKIRLEFVRMSPRQDHLLVRPHVARPPFCCPSMTTSEQGLSSEQGPVPSASCDVPYDTKVILGTIHKGRPHQGRGLSQK